MTAVLLVLLSLAAYCGIGLVIAALFVGWGLARVDHAALRAPLGFRLIIMPAAAILWPLVIRRWRRAAAPGGA